MYLTAPEVGYMGSFAVVGDCVSVAIGAALAMQLEKSGNIVVAYFGDAVPETGQFWEALNFAALHKLPIVFVCENNGYATQTPQEQRQPASAIWVRVAPWMSSQFISDRRGVEAIKDCIMAARQSAPAFVEIETVRFVEHVGPNPSPEKGVGKAIETNPLMQLELQLSSFNGGQHRLKPIWTAVNEAMRLAFGKAEA